MIRLAVYIKNTLPYELVYLLDTFMYGEGPPHIIICLRNIKIMFLYNEYTAMAYYKGGSIKMNRAKIFLRMKPILDSFSQRPGKIMVLGDTNLDWHDNSCSTVKNTN